MATSSTQAEPEYMVSQKHWCRTLRPSQVIIVWGTLGKYLHDAKRCGGLIAVRLSGLRKEGVLGGIVLYFSRYIALHL